MNQDLKNVIREIKFKRGLTQAQIASELGIKAPYLSDMVNGRVPYSDSLRRKIFELYSDCITDTGEGEMLKSNRVTSAPASNKNIPFYDIDVTASIAESFNDTPEIPQYYIDFPPLNDCTAAFPVYGESMEPDFFAGEVVLVKEITNVDSMLWGEPYLVITNANCDNLRTIKNVYLSEDRTKFILRATNPRYAGDTIIPRDDVLKIFLVKGKVNRRQL